MLFVVVAEMMVVREEELSPQTLQVALARINRPKHKSTG